jgi:cysteine desulfurase
MTIYLDNASTSPIDPDLVSVIPKLLGDYYGNPSSLHSQGRKSREILENSREIIANSIKASKHEIVFTSGATEAINLLFRILDFDLIITSPSEHASVIESAKASQKEIYWLSLDQEGFISLDELESILNKNKNKNKKILVSIMHVNNEIGTIQDLESIGSMVKKYSAFFFSDCVQSYGKLEIDVDKFKLDFISVSAHKLHGPKGVGFVYIRDLKSLNLDPFLFGGSQEFNLRSGTQNLISIIAFGQLIENSGRDLYLKRLEELEDYFFVLLSQTKELEFRLNGPKNTQGNPLKKLPGILNLSFMNIPLNSEQLVLRLDLLGFCISSGSACSSNKALPGIESSYVLRACGIPEKFAAKAIRISISRLNTESELLKITEVLSELCTNRYHRVNS